MLLDEPAGAVRVIAYDDIERARTVFEWGPTPKPGKGPKGTSEAEAGQGPAAGEGPSRRPRSPPSLREGRRTMSNPDMMDALQALAVDKGISVDTLFARSPTPSSRPTSGCPTPTSTPGSPSTPTRVDFRVIAQELDEEGEPTGPELDVTRPSDFSRVAAQTMKQVMNQRIREAEREMKYEEYAGREGDIVTGIIQQSDSRYTLLDLGRVEALLPQAEQVPYERPEPNARVKAYIVEVRKTAKGPQIVVSRTHPGPDQAPVRARGARDRRRRRRDQGLRP